MSSPGMSAASATLLAAEQELREQACSAAPALCAASLRHEGLACLRTPRRPLLRRHAARGSRSSATCRCRRYSRGASLTLSPILALTLSLLPQRAAPPNPHPHPQPKPDPNRHCRCRPEDHTVEVSWVKGCRVRARARARARAGAGAGVAARARATEVLLTVQSRWGSGFG